MTVAYGGGIHLRIGAPTMRFFVSLAIAGSVIVAIAGAAFVGMGLAL